MKLADNGIKMIVTKEELAIIRKALCRYSIKQISLAFDATKESEEKGLPDHYSHIYYELCDQIESIIADIDALDD